MTSRSPPSRSVTSSYLQINVCTVTLFIVVYDASKAHLTVIQLTAHNFKNWRSIRAFKAYPETHHKSKTTKKADHKAGRLQRSQREWWWTGQRRCLHAPILEVTLLSSDATDFISSITDIMTPVFMSSVPINEMTTGSSQHVATWWE